MKGNRVTRNIEEKTISNILLMALLNALFKGIIREFLKFI
jgi:hypothetical protein